LNFTPARAGRRRPIDTVICWRPDTRPPRSLLARQPLALSPVLRENEHPPPHASPVVSREYLPGRHPRVVGHRPPMAPHLDVQVRLADERRRDPEPLGVDVLIPTVASDFPSADELLKEFGGFLAERVERVADPALLIEIGRVHGPIKVGDRS